MAYVIAIIDSESGKLVDVAGNTREGARYAKFAKRMLSIGVNPVVLDYGANGGDSLEISKGGYEGEEINLKAKAVNISGDTLKVGGKTLEEIIGSSGGSSSGDIAEGTGISVSQEPDPDNPEKTRTVISISQDLAASIASIEQSMEEINPDSYVTKEALAGVVYGVEFNDGDTLESMKAKLNAIVGRIGVLVG